MESQGRTPTPLQWDWHFLPPAPVCHVGTGKELVGVPQLPAVGSLQNPIPEGAHVAQEFWSGGESPSLKGTSGVTCSAIPEWWL